MHRYLLILHPTRSVLRKSKIFISEKRGSLGPDPEGFRGRGRDRGRRPIHFILSIFLFISISVSAQSDFKLVDSTSYALFIQKQWKQLVKFGRQPVCRDFDYYYLNLRLGIANYETGKFYSAERYLKKALTQNNSSGVAAEYLYWVFKYTAREHEANDMTPLLNDSLRKYNYENRKKIMQYLYFEGGAKLSDRPESANTLLYGSIGIGHKISNYFSLYQSYSWIQQKLAWGNDQQHQYFVAPQYLFRNGWSFSAALNYFNYRRSFDYNNSINYTASTSTVQNIRYDTLLYSETLSKGNLNLNAFFTQFNLTKRFHGFSFTPQVAWYLELVKPNYSQTIKTDTIAIVTENQQQVSSDIIGSSQNRYDITNSASVNYLQLGATASWTNYFSRYHYLELGLEYISLLREQNWNSTFVPYFNAGISSKLGLQGYFVKKGYFPVSLLGGSVVLNSYDKLEYRFSLTGRFNIFKKSMLFLTAQHERINDNITLDSYMLFSIFTGLKLNL